MSLLISRLVLLAALVAAAHAAIVAAFKPSTIISTSTLRREFDEPLRMSDVVPSSRSKRLHRSDSTQETYKKDSNSAVKYEPISASSYFVSPYPPINPPNVGLNEFVLKDFHKWEKRDAIIDGKTGEKLSYGQILKDIHNLGINLSNKFDISRGECVGVFAPNHIHYFTTLASIAQTGAHSSPVNPLSPEDGLTKQMENSKAKLLIAHTAVAEIASQSAKKLGTPLIIMDAQSDNDEKGWLALAPLLQKATADGYPDGTSSIPGQPLIQLEYSEDLWTLPYSSGTTGLPKGTMLTHANLVANLLQIEPGEGQFITTEDRLITPLPFFHIYGMVVSLINYLRKGSTIIFLPTFDLELFLQLVQDHKATRAHLVPPVVLALAKSPLVGRYDVSSLKAVVSAAAPLDGAIEGLAAQRDEISSEIALRSYLLMKGTPTRATYEEFFVGNRRDTNKRIERFLAQILPVQTFMVGCIVKQAWGMTELSPVGTMVPDDALKPLSGTVGPLAPSTEGKVTDPATGEVLPVGEEGELHIRGPQVMKGYRGNAGATAACLAADGWLTTGDVARFDEEGYLYITERVKELIKYKGFQVPPAELEACLLGHPGVQDAIVIGVPHKFQKDAGEVPRAYVVLKEPGTHTAREIRAYVDARVAPFKKLRGGVEFRDAIPKSASGKLLRRVIREELEKQNQENKEDAA